MFAQAHVYIFSHRTIKGKQPMFTMENVITLLCPFIINVLFEVIRGCKSVIFIAGFGNKFIKKNKLVDVWINVLLRCSSIDKNRN